MCSYGFMKKKCLVCGKSYTPPYKTERYQQASKVCPDCVNEIVDDVDNLDEFISRINN